MTLLFTKDDGQSQPKSRDIQRNYGQLLGRLDELQPFFYIARYGAKPKELRGQLSISHPGLFIVGEKTKYGSGSGIAPRVGLILPASFCTNTRHRELLFSIPALLKMFDGEGLRTKRESLQARLDDVFSGNLVISDKETLNGFLALESKSEFFRYLQGFKYVVEVIDNPAGKVRINQLEDFYWRSRGDVMEWYYSADSDDYHDWQVFESFFVFGDTGSLTHYYTDRMAYQGLRRPSEEPARWFVIREGLSDSKPAVRLIMEEYGWAAMHLGLDDKEINIRLSQVFDPFHELVAWAKKIDENDLPIEMEIDEEGSLVTLTVLRTDHPDRVLLRAVCSYKEEIILEGIVMRQALGAALKSEIYRFFTTEFDPEHWDDEDAPFPTRERILGNTWFNRFGN